MSAELPRSVIEAIESLSTELSAAVESVGRGRIVREGLRVALAGPPNAGKSSLLNALAKSDLAIVSDEPGTTRDVREVALDLGGRLVILVDMAGLRDTESRAEAEGVRRAEAEIARADLVLWLVAPDVAALEPPVQTPLWTVGTKADVGSVAAEYALSSTTGIGSAGATHRPHRLRGNCRRLGRAGAGEPRTRSASPCARPSRRSIASSAMARPTRSPPSICARPRWRWSGCSARSTPSMCSIGCLPPSASANDSR